MRTHVYVKKYLICATNTVSVENLSESNFEALTLYCKSFAKLNYLVQHKSYSWLLLSSDQLSLREITTQNINFDQLCEIQFQMEKWIRKCQWPQAKKWFCQVSINITFKKGMTRVIVNLSNYILGIFTGKTHPQIKLKLSQKLWIWIFWKLVH